MYYDPKKIGTPILCCLLDAKVWMSCFFLQQATKPDSGEVFTESINPFTGWFYDKEALDGNIFSTPTAVRDIYSRSGAYYPESIDFWVDIEDGEIDGMINGEITWVELTDQDLNWFVEEDKFEIMSSIVPSRTAPLGQIAICGKGGGGQWDVCQFRSRIWLREKQL